MNRRAFLLASAGLSTALLARDSKLPELVVDTHTHFYDPTRKEGVPWPGKDNKLLYRPVLPTEFVKLARPLGVTGTVVVEASPWVEDNQWLLDLAAQDDFLLGVVGNLDPLDDAFPTRLARFAKQPRYRGLRLGHDKLLKGLESKTFRRQLGLLVDADLELDLNGGPDLATTVARLAGELPRLRLVINHAANVRIDGKAPPTDWRQGMQAAARHPNVFCKVSALLEGTRRDKGDAPTDPAFYRPVLDVLWNAFGAERLLYGSNWPVSLRCGSYATTLAVVRAYFQDKGREAADNFFGKNAQRAYALKR